MTLPEQVPWFPVMTVTFATTDTGSYRTVSGVPVQFIVVGLVRFRVC
jgi:hypothetical protein